MLGIDHIVYGGVWWFFNISIAYCVYRVKSPSLRLGKTPGRQAAVPRRMDAARRGFFGCRWSGQHFNLLDWNLINQAKHVIMSKQAAQRKLSDFSGKWTRFQICIAGKVQKAWQVPDDGEELQEEVGLLRDWDGWVSRPQVAPLTSHQNRYWWTWFSFHFPAIGVQQTLLFCVKGDFGKKHVVLKAIRKPSSFAEQMWCFFFFLGTLVSSGSTRTWRRWFGWWTTRGGHGKRMNLWILTVQVCWPKISLQGIGFWAFIWEGPTEFFPAFSRN